MARTPSSSNQPLAKQFDQVVLPHLSLLHRVAWRLLRNGPDADDLVQDVCIVACQQLAALRAADHPDRWLLRVLRNRFTNQYHRRNRAPFVALDEAFEAEGVSSAEPGPEELLDQGDRERALQYAFLQLDPVQRTLLALRAEGYSVGEIESITGIPREALHARLYRARCSFARHLELPHGETPSASPRSRSVK